jgi:hypothetical protein
MSTTCFRLVRTSRFGLLQPSARIQYTPRHFIRLSSSNTNPPPPNEGVDKPVPNQNEKHLEKHRGEGAEETPVQKSLAATRAYLEKVQLDLKPKLEPYIVKINNASEQLKRLTRDVSDSKEALARASRALNELTGYDQIDAVKQKVNNQGKPKAKHDMLN